MKIYINKPRNHWLSPYPIMEKVLFWKKWTDPNFDLYDDAKKSYTNWLVVPCRLLQKFLDFVHPKINYVKIDKWDTSNAYATLAMVILPMLKQFKITTKSTPIIEDIEDVPQEFRQNLSTQWDWVLSELIWTFEQLHPDTRSRCESQYYSGKYDMKWVPTGKTIFNQITKKDEATYEMIHGSEHTFKVDSEGLKAHNERIANGLRLFGKYYRSLWS